MSTQPPPSDPNYPNRRVNNPGGAGGAGGGWGWGWWILFLLIIIGVCCWWGWGGNWGWGRYPANNRVVPAPTNQPTANRPAPANSAQTAGYHEEPPNKTGVKNNSAPNGTYVGPTTQPAAPRQP